MGARLGQTVGNYRLVRQLGAGGMGAVYMAEHTLIGKKVALKVLHRELAQDREVVARFFNEARAVNQIGHEHIVDITDFGQSGGDHFFVMELLSGRSLAEVLAKEKRLAPPRALAIAAQIADALAAAHAAGVIHRDLKPENVLLVNRHGDRDFVKLLDFGLAKLLDGKHGKLTKAGVVLGTPQYMSPEQCESRTVDARSDVYALGVLLYQMVTGAVPFDGQTMAEILVKHVHEPPPPPRDVPPAVEAILMRCLAKAPAARYGSMIELREAVREAAAGLAPAVTSRPASRPALPASPRRREKRRLLSGLPLVLGLVGLVAGVASVIVTLARQPPAEQPLAARPLALPAPAADAAPARVVVEPLVGSVTVTTQPPGAQIVDEQTGSTLGVTPARLDLERGRELPVLLRLPGYGERREVVRAGADVTVELEKTRRRRGRAR
jgi:tRNA A-37 threonylcarbamoyl transferase component Bud32